MPVKAKGAATVRTAPRTAKDKVAPTGCARLWADSAKYASIVSDSVKSQCRYTKRLITFKMF